MTTTLSKHGFQEETFTASMKTPETLANPIRIDGGKVVLQSQVVLAPMAGVTDIVFRGLVRKTAPQSLICTEMISSNGLVYSKKWDAHILKKNSEDNPIAYQLAAHQEEIITQAAITICEKHQPDTLDINMGCPVKKITGNFEGCALMKDLDLASRLIKAVSSNVNVPVSVKFRLGWDDNSKNYDHDNVNHSITALTLSTWLTSAPLSSCAIATSVRPLSQADMKAMLSTCIHNNT
jgi:tRNA-dihydrouridine synthase